MSESQSDALDGDATLFYESGLRGRSLANGRSSSEGEYSRLRIRVE